MSVYNGERFLREALDSVLCQTFTDFEFIVVDDGSTDRTAEILRSYGERLQVHTQSNQGLSRALNVGLALACGQYIARMDADDVSQPERLRRQVDYLDAHAAVGLLGTAYSEIDERGHVLRTVTMPADDAELRRTLAKFNPFMHGSVMVRKVVIEESGPYDESELLRHSAEDYELWVRLAQHTQIANLSDVLMQRRLHRDALSARHDNNRLRGMIHVRARAIRALGLPPWYWWHVLLPALALPLPPALRTLLRRLRYRGQPYR
jgi:glycosyltransferase involved in cell wall biosynthesis